MWEGNISRAHERESRSVGPTSPKQDSSHGGSIAEPPPPPPLVRVRFALCVSGATAKIAHSIYWVDRTITDLVTNMPQIINDESMTHPAGFPPLPMWVDRERFGCNLESNIVLALFFRGSDHEIHPKRMNGIPRWTHQVRRNTSCPPPPMGADCPGIVSDAEGRVTQQHIYPFTTTLLPTFFIISSHSRHTVKLCPRASYFASCFISFAPSVAHFAKCLISRLLNYSTL